MFFGGRALLGSPPDVFVAAMMRVILSLQSESEINYSSFASVNQLIVSLLTYCRPCGVTVIPLRCITA